MDYFKEKEEASISGGLYFKAQEGENKIRVVSEPIKIWKAFDKVNKTAKVYTTEKLAALDKNSKKRICMYVLNRQNNKLQIAEFGPQIWIQFLDLATSSEYGFVNLPPYDMILIKKGEGMETEYTLQAARNNLELTEDERKKVDTAESLSDIIKLDSEEFKNEIQEIPI